ncbi:MAG: arginine N-succinyltransferase [Desulfuromonas sp.]|nr:MAG: arginine N-succinyltransferase [Desulfuromonas sp.]
MKIFGIVVVACIVSTLVAVTAVYFFLFPGPFKPVDLSTKEEQALEQKLDRLGSLNRTPSTHKSQDKHGAGGSFKPEKYTESDADREITLTEREINALLAKNTDLAEKLVIDLSEDMASAKLRIPLDEDFPFIGGKTLKVSAGLEMSYRAGRPVVVLRGVSLWGVPLPNAWLGNIKNIDMVKEFGAEQGFWKAFADGVDEIEIRDGQLRVKVNE